MTPSFHNYQYRQFLATPDFFKVLPVPWWWRVCYPFGKHGFHKFAFLIVRRRFNKMPMTGKWWFAYHCFPLFRLGVVLQNIGKFLWKATLIGAVILTAWVMLGFVYYIILGVFGIKLDIVLSWQ